MRTFQHWAGCYSRHSSWQTAGMQLLIAWTRAEQNTSDKVLYLTADCAHRSAVSLSNHTRDILLDGTQNVLINFDTSLI